MIADLTRDFVSADPDDNCHTSTILPYLAPNGPRVITEAALEEGAGKLLDQSEVIRGFMDFPTHPPVDDLLAGDAHIRVTDIHFWNAAAGEGKSVAMSQISMAWALNLPYCGIYPSRPLKIIHFCGEDDASTLGQCREGFLLHSEAITGRKLVAADLKPLDDMVRTDFSREFTGDAFLQRLDEMLTDDYADVILINPLLSFIGGGIVETVSKFLREGLGPILKRHRCAALISHHTCKLNRDSWENMDFTYSGIGGGEVANIPRSIFTLAPTKVKGLRVIHVSKRQTVGWKDDEGKFIDHSYFKRTDDPKLPAWLPVSHADAAALIGDIGHSSSSRNPKATIDHVIEILAVGAMTRQTLILKLMEKSGCGFSTAKTVISNAQLGAVVSFTDKDKITNRNFLFFCLPEHLNQWVKVGVKVNLTLNPDLGPG